MGDLSSILAQAREKFDQQRATRDVNSASTSKSHRLSLQYKSKAVNSKDELAASKRRNGKGRGLQTDVDKQKIFDESRLDASRRALEAKALRYERLDAAARARMRDDYDRQEGSDHSDGFDGSDDPDAPLIDFSAKYMPASSIASSNLDLFETVDEFGRSRMVSSKVADETVSGRLARMKAAQERFRPETVIENPDYFPKFNVDENVVRELNEQEAKVKRVRYDSSTENREHGAAFYQFSLDEKEREKQLAELNKLHEETMKLRNRAESQVAGHHYESEENGGRQEIIVEKFLDSLVGPEEESR